MRRLYGRPSIALGDLATKISSRAERTGRRARLARSRCTTARDPLEEISLIGRMRIYDTVVTRNEASKESADGGEVETEKVPRLAVSPSRDPAGRTRPRARAHAEARTGKFFRPACVVKNSHHISTTRATLLRSPRAASLCMSSSSRVFSSSPSPITTASSTHAGWNRLGLGAKHGSRSSAASPRGSTRSGSSASSAAFALRRPPQRRLDDTFGVTDPRLSRDGNQTHEISRVDGRRGGRRGRRRRRRTGEPTRGGADRRRLHGGRRASAASGAATTTATETDGRGRNPRMHMSTAPGSARSGGPRVGEVRRGAFRFRRRRVGRPERVPDGDGQARARSARRHAREPQASRARDIDARRRVPRARRVSGRLVETPRR